MTAKVEEALRFISRFAWLNMIWIGFTLLGGVLLGLFPATYALFTMVQRWVRDGEQDGVGKQFKQVYKHKFWQANGAGWLLAVIGAVLFINYQVIVSAGGSLPLLVVLAFLFVVSFYALMLVMIFPVWVFYQGGIVQALGYTARFILGRLHVAIGFAVIVWGGVYLSLAFPALILFFSGSVLAYMLAWFLNRSIERLTMKTQVKQEGWQQS
ncbi:YesL family protein [Alkalicoccus luteus]|uniref:YesL family protein n=1 Tax=Alkalicoccus luteus TaxID=1237094 RepID=UPI004033ADC9